MSSQDPKVPELCRHQFRIEGGWLPCPYCKPDEAAALRGAPTTAEDRRIIVIKSAAMRNQEFEHIAKKRMLQLVGQTLAGCVALRVAADSTANTRFLWRMSCGHEEVRDGTEIKTFDKNGATATCKACAKAATGQRRKRRSAPGGDVA